MHENFENYLSISMVKRNVEVRDGAKKQLSNADKQTPGANATANKLKPARRKTVTHPLFSRTSRGGLVTPSPTSKSSCRPFGEGLICRLAHSRSSSSSRSRRGLSKSTFLCPRLDTLSVACRHPEELLAIVSPHNPPLHQTLVHLLTEERRSGITPWDASSTSASRSFRPL